MLLSVAQRIASTQKSGDPMRNMPFRVAVLAALLAGAAYEADAATFDLATKPDGSIVPGLRVEGEIVPGDAQRLLESYAKYGTEISPIYLRSEGGDVEEAMQMGAIVRRLRLETSVPVWDAGRPPVDSIEVDKREDTICASACFLVYAGGATRFGNYLALHRPYLARKDAQALSDVEYEALQKVMTAKVKAYLADMGVDQYWIDRMFAANSQGQYMPTWAEADNKVRHLMGMVPSLEEVVLSKCTEDPDVDRKLQAFRATRTGPLTPADIEKMKKIMHELDVFDECQKSVLSDMQTAAFERENEPFITRKCADHPPLTPSDIDRLKVLIAKGQAKSDTETAEQVGLLMKANASRQCRASTLYEIQIAALQRWDKEVRENIPRQIVAKDFDASELAPAEMVRRGKQAYEAEQWNAAARWFRKAADLGDADAMMGMSWIYGKGRGVAKDDAEALRWVRMAADRGSTVAMDSLGHDYEDGSRGMAQDYREAMRWYEKAVDKGSAEAMMNVGYLYYRGLGVPLDDGRAMEWFRKAADAGSGLALWQIGVNYASGRGVPKNDEQARYWMKKAVTSGDDIARSVANRWLVDHPAP